MKKCFVAALAALLGVGVLVSCNSGMVEFEDDVTGFYDAANDDRGIFSKPKTTDSSECDYMVSLALGHVRSGKTVRYTDSAMISALVNLGYAYIQTDGPISITKAKMNGRKTVYVVCLSGTDVDVKQQSTGYWTDLLSGFEFENDYVRNVRSVVCDNVPAGAELIFAGHSLGGMISQQCAADDTLKNRYNIINTVTFGSPLIDGFKREGTVKRLGDTSDAVPYLSVSTFINIFWQSLGLNKEDGGYGNDLLAAHTQSYNRSSVWGAYDVTGTKNGGSYLDMDFSSTKFYHSPTNVGLK